MTTSFIENLGSDNHQKLAIQIALFNAAFIVLLALCGCGLFAIYNMMFMFFTPILWAALVGTVVFPLKREVSDALKGWLDSLDEQNQPLAIGLALLPYHKLVHFSDAVFGFVFSTKGLCAGVAYLVLNVLNYDRTFITVLSSVGSAFSFVDSVIQFFTVSSIFLPLIILYTAAYAAWLYVQEADAVNKKFARSLSVPIWVFLLAYVSSFFGPVRVLVFIVAAVALALLSAGVIAASDDDVEQKPEIDSDATKTVEADGEASVSENPIEAIALVKPVDHLEHALASDKYISMIAVLCLLIWTVHHNFVVYLLLLPLAFAVPRQTGIKLGLFDSLWALLVRAYESAHQGFDRIAHVAVAGPLRKFVKLLFSSDKIFASTLRAQADVISSVAVMSAIALGTLFLLFFSVFQLHSETTHLVKLASEVVSSNPEWLKYAVNYTEDQLKEHDFDNYVEQAYQHGRSWLAANIRSLADPKDTKRADDLEEQIKLLVDNFYRLWEERNIEHLDASNLTTPTSIVDHFTSATDFTALKTELTAVISDNIDTVISIGRSLWAVVAMNLSVLSTIFISIFGFILGFGFDLLNFFIEIIVFLMVVFYLLNYSTNRWLPFSWIESIFKPLVASSDAARKADIPGAIELAISGVFVLSAKMAVFYGLYTYFVHSLFGLNVVFVPSITAAIFAAIPIMPPYSVLIFGAVELFIIRQEVAAGFVFVSMCIAPMMFADSAFYKEVKNSHPYVTGLAIIGGMYWLGLQGAIIGPIILCTMLALVNVYAQFAKN